MCRAMSSTDIAIAALTFVLAGLVKGLTGLGLPTVGVGLLSLIMPPAQAAALVVVPALLTNLWQMLAGPALKELCLRLWPMLAGICLGTWAGGRLLAGMETKLAAALLGVALLAYALTGLVMRNPPRLAGPWAAWLGLAAGAVTGLVTAVTGVFVIPAVPYLQALALPRDRLLQALGLSFTVSTLAMAALLAGTGNLGGAMAWASLLALAPALVGMQLGRWLGSLTRPETFRRCFFAGLLLLGAHLALRPLL